ncbi:MAG: hypothetical protein ACPGWR_24620 [Ardenticatenaceae bacterium]
MYVQSELLNKVKKQLKHEFKQQIISFEWFHEEEYTTIMVQVREVAFDIPVRHRLREIVNAIIGHPETSEYIVSISVSATESLDATDGLFNLAYRSGSDSFFLYYDAPEREGANPFKVSIGSWKIFDSVRTIHQHSPARLWEQLFRPIREAYVKRQGIESFSKEGLAEALRDFLLEHLDFIKHIAQATRTPLQIIEPVSMPKLSQSTNGTGREHKRRLQTREAPEMALAVAAD